MSSILLWLETSKVLNLVFCGSSIPFQYRINREYYSGWETHCHLVYGFEFLLSAKSFLSLLNQRKIKMTVIFVVPNTQCFSMTRDDIWWVGMSTEAHKLKFIQTFGCGTLEYLPVESYHLNQLPPPLNNNHICLERSQTTDGISSSSKPRNGMQTNWWCGGGRLIINEWEVALTVEQDLWANSWNSSIPESHRPIHYPPSAHRYHYYYYLCLQFNRSLPWNRLEIFQESCQEIRIFFAATHELMMMTVDV